MIIGDTLYVEWCIDDVLQQDSTLTREQAIEVLELLDNKHDATIGINWDVIDCAIEEVKRDN